MRDLVSGIGVHGEPCPEIVQSQVCPDGSLSCQAEMPRTGRFETVIRSQPGLSGAVTTWPSHEAVAREGVKVISGLIVAGFVAIDPSAQVAESLESLEYVTCMVSGPAIGRFGAEKVSVAWHGDAWFWLSWAVPTRDGFNP